MSDESENEEGDIVEVKGRKPYNKTKLRLARGEYENRETPGYVSWQSKINIGPGRTIDEDILESYLNGEGSHYEELDLKDIKDLPSGVRFAYITKSQKWRSAGWLSRIEESYEDTDGNKFKNPKLYLLYKSYNNACFPVQLDDIEAFYVMKPKIDPGVIIEKPIYLKKPKKRTNFPVKIEDEDGYEVVVYYAKDNYDRDRFKNTQKYKNAIEDPERWLFEDNTQEPSVRE
jgi:hypothetical protein